MDPGGDNIAETYKLIWLRNIYIRKFKDLKLPKLLKRAIFKITFHRKQWDEIHD